MKFNSPEEAYNWAFEHGPSNESREAVLSSPKYAYLYALNVDDSPRDDTRKATLSSPSFSYWYAIRVDKSPRNDTREATLGSPDFAYWYVRVVDKGVIYPDVAKVMKPLLLTNDKWAIRLFKEFGNGK